MDWGAIGAIAAIFAIVVALMQYRHTVLTGGHFGVGAKPTTIKYKVTHYQCNIDKFDVLKVDFGHDSALEFESVRRVLRNLHLAIFIVQNKNRHIARGFSCEVDAQNVLVSKVESTKKLASSAVSFEVKDRSVVVSIDEMPPSETVIFSILAGYHVGWKLMPINASIELEMVRE